MVLGIDEKFILGKKMGATVTIFFLIGGTLLCRKTPEPVQSKIG